MNTAAKVLCGLFIIAIGMAGLHFKVEYSGRVLFVGCMLAVSVA